MSDEGMGDECVMNHCVAECVVVRMMMESVRDCVREGMSDSVNE